MKKSPVDLKAGSPDEELVAKLGPGEGSRIPFRGIIIHMESTAKLDPEVAIRRLKKGSSPLDTRLNACTLFWLPGGLFQPYLLLQRAVFLLGDLPALQQNIQNLLDGRLFLVVLSQRSGQPASEQEGDPHEQVKDGASHNRLLS